MYTQLNTDFQYDFVLFGLSADSKEYKLAWQLNKICDCRFRKVRDISLNIDKGLIASFSHFYYTHGAQTWRLLKNYDCSDTYGKVLLMPELNQWNFLLWLDDPGDHVSVEELKRKIETIAEIKSFSQISVDLLPNKDNLLF